MAETGKFSRHNSSAILLYSVDFATGAHHIENVDEQGYEFLSSLEIGDKITLENSWGQWNLQIIFLDVHKDVIQCLAIISK
jgi:hypothetical protein